MSRVFISISLGAALYLWGLAVISQWAIRSLDRAVLPADAPLSVKEVQPQGGPIYFDNDSIMWTLFAEQAMREKMWRVRWTEVDNTPTGRPVHWSSGPIWFLVSVGGLWSFFSGKSAFQAIESAAYWWNPFVHLVLVLLAMALVMRRFGTKVGAVAGISLATLPALSWTFHTARPDHHGLQVLFIFLSGLLPWLGGMGWVIGDGKTAEKGLLNANVAKRYFMGAGVAAAAGLWTGAVIQSAAFVAFGIGIVVGLCLAKVEQGARYEPLLWRWWGLSGAATAICFYLIEYAPSSFGFNLEINHPWYAVCFAAGGEALFRLGKLKTGGSWKRETVPLSLAAGVVLTLPLAVLFGPPHWHALKDPWMLRMHDSIREFMPYGVVYGETAWWRFWSTLGVLPFGLLGSLFLLRLGKPTARQAAGLWMGLMLSAAMLAAMLHQNRWNPFFAIFVLLLALVLCETIYRNRRLDLLLLGLLAAQALVFGALTIRAAYKFGTDRTDKDLAVSAIFNRTALRWKELRGNQEWRILAEPTDGPTISAVTGSPTVTTFYWENLDGLRDATSFMTDPGDSTAREIARKRGLTHVIVNETPEPAKFYAHVRFDVVDMDAARTSLAGRLSRRLPPAWLRLNDEMTEIAQKKYRNGNFIISQKFLVYDVDQKILKNEP